jgi:hypothetical protein
MAKLFLSYPFTGVHLPSLTDILTNISNSLTSEGNTVFCALLCKEEIDELGIFGYEARLAYCLEKQKEAQMVIAIIMSATPSNGMLQELNQAKQRNQPYVLFIKKELEFPEFRAYAHKIVEYTLPRDLQELSLSSIDEKLDTHYSVVA